MINETTTITEALFEYVHFVAANSGDPQEWVDFKLLEIFRHFYCENFEKSKKQYELYASNEEIQEILVRYELDPDKFWCLFLYIKHHTDACCAVKNIDREESVKEIASEISSMIADNGFSSIKISCGNKSVKTSNPYITILLSRIMKELAENGTYSDISIAKPKWLRSDTYYTNMKFAYSLYNNFLLSYAKMKRGRRDFIFRFLYLSDYIEDEGCLNGYTMESITRKNLDGKEKILTTKVSHTSKNTEYYNCFKNSLDSTEVGLWNSPYTFIPD